MSLRLRRPRPVLLNIDRLQFIPDKFMNIVEFHGTAAVYYRLQEPIMETLYGAK